jgi:hypothetical protein
MAAICAYISAIWAGAEDPVWPHLVLIPLSVFAGIAVGAGIVFEAPKYSEKAHKRAFWAVVLGIAIESLCTVLLFVVDERISAAQQSTIELQQSKIIELETKLAPRELSSTQRESVAAAIKSFSGMHVDFAMDQSLESMNLLDEVEGAILSAGWEEVPPPPNVATFNRGNKPPVAIRTNAAVWVLYPLRSGEPFKSAAESLAKSLRQNGLIVGLNVILGADPYDLDKIHVWTGAKPSGNGKQ